MRKKLLFILLVAFSCNMAWGQTPAYIPATGLTSFSEFDGSHVFTGYNYSDLFTTDRNGVADNAILFQGRGNIYSSNYLPVSRDSITVATWFKFDGYSTFFTSGNYTPSLVDYKFDPFCPSHGCQPINLRVVYDGTTPFIEANVNVFDNIAVQQTFYTAGGINTSNINIGTWYHVAMTWDNQTDELILYLNGAAIDTVATPGGAFLNDVQASGTRIGATNGTVFQTCFNGALDELGFWSRALTPAEIQNIYVQSAPISTGCDAPEILTQSWQNDTITICAHCDDFGASCNTSLSAATLSLPNTSYAWYNTNGMVSASAALNIRYWSGLPAGPYWIVGMNACDTITSDTVYLNYYTSFSSSIDEAGNVLTAVTNSTNNTYTYTYEWYDGNLNLLGTSNAYTATVSGTYYVKIMNQFGCSSISSTNITVGGCTNPAYNGLTGANTLAGITIADTITVCFGSDIAVQVNFNNATTYDWFRNGVSLNRNQNDLAYSSALEGTYYATATNSCGTTVSDTFVIRTSANYLVYATQVGSQVELAFIPALPAGATASAVWYDNSNNQVSTSIPFTPLADGQYNAEVTVTYDNSYNYTFSSCTFSSSSVQYVAPVSCPNPPMLNPASVDICQGDSYNFDGQVLTQAGTYFAAFTDANGCDSLVELTLSVFDAPATPTIVANGDTLSVETTDTVALDYTWYLDGDLISGETAATLVATSNGDYTVEVSLGNCSAVSTALTYTSVGIDENTFAQKVSIYPNPTSGLLQINANIGVAFTYLVFNATGQIVASGKASGNTAINLTNYASGIYLLHLANNNGDVTTKRIVKE